MASTTDDLRDLNADDEEEDEENSPVRLAFLRDPDGPEELQRHRFPDKAGGAPAWLDPVNLPTGEARLCGFCGEPLRFALQVYAPLPPWEGEDDEEDAAYHRALFVFMCPAMACLLLDQRQQRERDGVGDDAGGCRRRSVRVFRCQLPLENAFYYYDASGDGEEEPRGEARCTGVEVAPLCEWCGTWGAEMVFEDFTMALRLFCSEKHLRGGGHSASAWPEYAIFSEDEKETLANDAGGGGVPSASAWPEHAAMSFSEEAESSSTAVQEQSGGNDDYEQENAAADDDQAAVDDAWMAAFEADEDTAQWATFQARVSAKQDQVLRYCDGGGGGGGGPLWAVASGSLPPGTAPPCPRCGGARRYEMQLMPQLLHYFHVEAVDPDPLDWATVAVYTCARSCGDGGGGYVEEFAWVQLLPPPTTTAATAGWAAK